MLNCALFKLGQSQSARSKIFVLSTGDWFEEFKFYLAFYFFFAQISCTQLDLIPVECAIHGSLDLWLVNRRILSQSDIPIDDEEAKIWLLQSSSWVEYANFCIGWGLLLLSCNHNAARLSHSSTLIDKRFSHNLVTRGYDLVHWEDQSADKVVTGKVFGLLGIVIRVVHLYHELFLLLEVKVYHDLAHELRVQVVMDNFGLPDLSPCFFDLLVQDTEGVWLWESVHIWELLALEA